MHAFYWRFVFCGELPFVCVPLETFTMVIEAGSGVVRVVARGRAGVYDPVSEDIEGAAYIVRFSEDNS